MFNKLSHQYIFVHFELMIQQNKSSLPLKLFNMFDWILFIYMDAIMLEYMCLIYGWCEIKRSDLFK